MNASAPQVLVMAGGTGGHVFPGLALATALRERGWRVSWLGTARGIEANLVPQAGFELHTLPIAGLRGKGLAGRLLAPWRLGISLWAALVLMLRLRPQVVVGFGGFASGPGGLMAAALGRPLLVHEQNAVAGMTNRWLARVADGVFAGFPDTFPEKVAAHTVGNPVRRAIVELASPQQRWAGRSGPLRVLVLGGSLGARTLNRVVPAALALLPQAARPQVRHQAGERTLDEALAGYHGAAVEAEVTAFIEDMAQAYGWADLVICRAGALTVAEVAAAGVPAVFVPYPHAVDDHQTANAAYLVAAGAAWCLADADLTPELLADRLRGLGREELLERAVKARGSARTDATERLVDACREMARKTTRRATR
ncbi:UDP-N-acetylglucosamine--N-acetylmuramyl- (pentapeptide) pyrophosphoryl-undecaprenol N-acetylglucosamine transferase [Thioalkalivibrio nitratireducens DSM 14787]|uniref:UDP-N-acetylglucosamine--N-acetylmuramyl-(pentapeptide) pyrophosphoryl-undecaprenol N-acetylglucosamine transferase n=1 Tax=Thioalkalivibrio nitratireducens (strain DSM 14787 / UNIQEM 213 / ALEN2) TaxID=1255043 RepID=L0DZ52_THIND|nr:undecaprenyldiphospho-muramoylpentapeptide beta-N-acetylglucosaminyltransferase [Thioalkalivibrio nitratireducens]AGA34245.1 UDP-N-acetylglucosamine--N-acetylmuramyl- (pentapeptide) pyrophosphoryl-undecaprenol N-acetylglucosamine transferase [Thioalkalivibrio nitratireducens DSM 14787]